MAIKRNLTALIKHTLAIDYAEVKLDKEPSKIRMPREDLSKKELIEIISKLKKPMRTTEIKSDTIES